MFELFFPILFGDETVGSLLQLQYSLFKQEKSRFENSIFCAVTRVWCVRVCGQRVREHESSDCEGYGADEEPRVERELSLVMMVRSPERAHDEETERSRKRERDRK